MIEPNHPMLSIGAQCLLLSISRSSFYYESRGETGMNLALMLLIDRQFPPLGVASQRLPGNGRRHSMASGR